MKLSVITAVYNGANYLPSLIESLRNQSDKCFEWILIDGASTDGTLALLKSITDLNLVLTSAPDFGIYDALNKGVEISSGEFYLVLGVDDSLHPDAIKNYKDKIADDVDIITGSVVSGSCIWSSKVKRPWLYGHVSYVSCHSVGSIFRKKLHLANGMYSSKFPIAADQYFILKCCLAGAKVLRIDNLIGEYGSTGVSSVDTLGTLTEFFRVQVLCGFNKNIQLLLLFFRICLRFIQGKI